MSMSTGRAQLVGAFGAIYLLWGGTYLAIALGLQSIPPFLLIGARSVLGGAVLLALSGLSDFTRQPWEDWRHAAISGALLFVGCHGALAYAQRYVPSGLSAVILATIPFWIVLVNLSIGQSEPLRKLLALVPGLAGVGLIAWNETSNPQHSLPIGMIALLVASSLSWALGSVYAQRRASHIPAHDLAGMQLVCGGVSLLVLGGIAGEWTRFAPHQVSMASIGGLLYLALFGSAVGNTAYLWLLDRMSAPIVASYTFVNPVIALILGVWVLGERITIPSLVGTAFVISSVAALLYFANADEWRRQAPTEAPS
jgi:drug/metabolite transporter (DMT)-like permease